MENTRGARGHAIWYTLSTPCHGPKFRPHHTCNQDAKWNVRSACCHHLLCETRIWPTCDMIEQLREFVLRAIRAASCSSEGYCPSFDFPRLTMLVGRCRLLELVEVEELVDVEELVLVSKRLCLCFLLVSSSERCALANERSKSAVRLIRSDNYFVLQISLALLIQSENSLSLSIIKLNPGLVESRMCACFSSS